MNEDITQAQVGELMEKYRVEIEKQMGHEVSKTRANNYSKEYQDFKKEIYPANFTLYEKACNFLDKYIGIKPDSKKVPALQNAIETCHLNITPSGAYTFAMIIPLIIIVVGSFVSYFAFDSLFFAGFFVLLGGSMIIPLNKIPEMMAANWRMKASNQMVLCVFYVVTYLRHTSNLENAVDFAAEHIGPPLSLDLKKVLWDVETEKYSTVKESLDNYMDRWRKSNGEFVGAFELIESSLYESSESRRLAVLDKSLEVILTETFEKMLHYAHDLKSPITMLNMLGIIMPILGLVILPLVVSFMQEAKWYHIAVLYNIIIPLAVYYFGRTILTKRPTGYGDTDITELNPELKKYKNVLIRILGFEIQINPIYVAGFIFFLLFSIGISPLVIHHFNPEFDMVLYGKKNEFAFKQDLAEKDQQQIKYSFLDYKTIKVKTGEEEVEYVDGPFGLGASILSIFIVLAFGLSIGIYNKLRSSNVIEIRQRSKDLEKEFASALFQLGNRLGDGLPAELAFDRVGNTLKDSVSGKFCEMVSMNIQRMGMSVEQAIFDENIGAILSFPSKIIESSMKVLIQSIKKGPQIAANALMNISRYIKEIHKVDERLKDLLGEIISSMKAQISFMTPAIAGIVIGITSMISTILGKLTILMKRASSESEGAQIPDLFGEGVPTFYFMLIVGIYVVQMIYILTVISNGIENGEDKLNEKYQLGINMVKSTILFCTISLIIMIIFNIIATTIIWGTLNG